MAMDTLADRIITATIGEFCRISGIGRTRIYELIASGELDSISIGKRRLIVLDSYRRLIERQRGTPAERPAAAPPQHRGAGRGDITAR
jgi:excisionase family DNA binding protein